MWIQLALVVVLGLAMAATIRLRPSWFAALGLLAGLVCPACRRGVLKTSAMWSWTMTEAGQLVVLRQGTKDPSPRRRSKMEREFPERGAETFMRCTHCEAMFVRRESHPLAGAASSVVEPCSDEEWRQAIEP